MNLLSFSSWLAAGDITVPGLTPQESAALILLAASLLVFRAFRERYLLIWTLGWLAYFVSRWTLGQHAAGAVPAYLIAISHAEFVLAICLFAAAIFVYTNARQPIAALNEQAWGAALLLLIFVLTINILVRARTWSTRSR